MFQSPSPSTSRGTKRSRDNPDGKHERRSRSPARSDSEVEEGEESEQASTPPLPDEQPPPLPSEKPPGAVEDDGWEPVWDGNAQAFYFYNRFTNVTQWENPRVPEALGSHAPPGTEAPSHTPQEVTKPERPVGGYDPSIHGDYDPNADYAKTHESTALETSNNAPTLDPTAVYAATGAFNRFTGRWQASELTPENFNDENKSKRQMNAYFDVDAAANSHDGRSLKAERAGKKLSRKEVKAFKEKRREKKEEKRRAWLRD
ncbi:MAG: hypothetical protein Q9227_008320 [Pyrenula ochraceoflavens]